MTEGSVILNSLQRVLRPVIRLLLRHGVGVDAFEQAARRIYVDVAECDFVLSGRKQSDSRIAVLTGLNRKEVARLRKQPLGRTEVSSDRFNRAERVLTAWLREPEFLDSKGDPKELMFAGRCGFGELVRQFSGDVPPRAVAEELLRVGAVEEVEDGKLRLVARGYVPDPRSEDAIEIFGIQGADMLETMDRNIAGGDVPTRFQRQVTYDGVPEDCVDEFRGLSARLGQRLLEDLDRWLAARKEENRSAAPAAVRLGLGIYQVETRADEESEPGRRLS